MDTILKERKNILIKELQNQGVGQVFIFDPANIFYYTGFYSNPHERFMALFIHASSKTYYLFVPSLDKDAAKESDVSCIHAISDEENPYEVIKNVLPSLSGIVGVEGNVITHNRALGIKENFPNIQLENIQVTLGNIRLKKSPDEVEKIQVAINLIEKVLQKGMNKVRPGMTEIELTAELEYLMRKVGADGPSFSTIVLSGAKAALPHGVPDTTKIQRGDLLLIDFGVVKNNYCSDITRTFSVGEPSSRHRELYNIVLEATNTGIEAVKEGVPLKDIDYAARKVIEDAGYGEYFNNRIGHGMGINVHEEPSIHSTNNDLVEKGMVFTIEPGIYIPGEIGIRIEDNVYINSDGIVEVLTSYPKVLQDVLNK